MSRDTGVSASADRATHEPNPQAVSAVPVGIADASGDPIVGHKTMADGSHLPLRKSEADAITAQVEAERERRETSMPDERSALEQLWQAQRRLQDFGWQNPIYAPKDGSALDLIEIGSTGIHRGHYEGNWPTGSWWIADAGDLWPSRPALARAAISKARTTVEAGQ